MVEGQEGKKRREKADRTSEKALTDTQGLEINV